MFCREHVVQLHRQIDRIHAAGAELVVIGSGTPNTIPGFREVTGYGGPLYTDPRLGSFRAAGLRRGVCLTVNPLVVLRGVRTMARGHFQGRTQGDPFQQGGVLVVAAPGRIRYRHVSAMAGDNAPAAEVVAALENTVRLASAS